MALGDLQHLAEVIAERDVLKAKLAGAESSAETYRDLAHDLKAKLEEAEVDADSWKRLEGARRAAAVRAVERAADTERRVVGEIAEWLESKAIYSQNRNIGSYTAGLAQDVRLGAYRKQGGRR